MNLQEIKDAVDAGRVVHWATSSYRVIKDDIGQYLIGFDIGGSGENWIGLTHSDGVTLNGHEWQFFLHSSCPTCRSQQVQQGWEGYTGVEVTAYRADGGAESRPGATLFTCLDCGEQFIL